MVVALNHTIIPAQDKQASAEFLAKILGISVGAPNNMFVPLRIGESLTLDYADMDFAQRGVTSINPQHFAFEVDGVTFDAIFQRIVDAQLDYYANPLEPKQYGEINLTRGGRNVYFDDPNGHIFEVLTKS